MRLPVEALGYEVVGELPVLGVFGKGKVQKQVLESAQNLGSQLAKLVI